MITTLQVQHVLGIELIVFWYQEVSVSLLHTTPQDRVWYGIAPLDSGQLVHFHVECLEVGMGNTVTAAQQHALPVQKWAQGGYMCITNDVLQPHPCQMFHKHEMTAHFKFVFDHLPLVLLQLQRERAHTK